MKEYIIDSNTQVNMLDITNELFTMAILENSIEKHPNII